MPGIIPAVLSLQFLTWTFILATRNLPRDAGVGIVAALRNIYGCSAIRANISAVTQSWGRQDELAEIRLLDPDSHGCVGANDIGQIDVTEQPDFDRDQLGYLGIRTGGGKAGE